MKDSWETANPYEYFMGRWSRIVADLFIDWLSPTPASNSRLKWLDVGCGSGALSEGIINKHNPQELTAIDQSEGFVNMSQQRLGSQAICKTGNALDLPLENSSVDFCVSGLVLNFILEPEKALSEMKRVTKSGGTVAIYVWDYAGQMDFLNYFWDSAIKLNSDASTLHESIRFPNCNTKELKALFNKSGFTNTETAPLEITTHFQDFDDYWKPFLGGQGPAPTYVMSLSESERSKLRETLRENLPIQADGSIPMVARAWAIKGLA